MADTKIKYIPVNKLIAEIERQKKAEGWCEVGKDTADEYYARGFRFACNNLLAFITSLQQEQPEGLHFTPLNRLIQKIPSKNWNDTVNNYAKKLRDCLIKEGYRKDAEVLQGYISYMNGNNVPMATMDEHEQPEVDLDKLGGIARHLIAVKDHEEDMRLDEGEWLLLKRIGYPERFNARKEK